MVGAALVRRLGVEACEILTVPRSSLDLRDQAAVRDWMVHARPNGVIVAAAKVGGILANARLPAEFLYDNLMIAANIIEAAHRCDVEKLLFLGSSAVYPRLAEQPMREEALLTGALEPTHEAYAVAKIAGVKLTQAYRHQYDRDFIAALPTNLYGPGDNFDLKSGHVVPALMRRVHEAKRRGDASITVWGTGKPRREFLHVDDCADACVHLLEAYSDTGPINLGSGEDLSISELTRLICEVVGFKGEIVHDFSKPDGPPRKLMRADKLRGLGWKPKIDLKSGLSSTYEWFSENELRRTGSRV